MEKALFQFKLNLTFVTNISTTFHHWHDRLYGVDLVSNQLLAGYRFLLKKLTTFSMAEMSGSLTMKIVS